MNFTKTPHFDEWWWLEIKTIIPKCIYYFGPFFSEKEAQTSQYGYIEDLIQEKAYGITVEAKKANPQELTIESTGK